MKKHALDNKQKRSRKSRSAVWLVLGSRGRAQGDRRPFSPDLAQELLVLKVRARVLDSWLQRDSSAAFHARGWQALLCLVKKSGEAEQQWTGRGTEHPRSQARSQELSPGLRYLSAILVCFLF